MGPDAEFGAFLADGRFMIQRSAQSGRAVFPPRAVEPGKGGALEWIAASGRGTVYSTTVVRKRAPEPSYNVALIDLAEGPRMMSRVERIAPEAVTIGMAVMAMVVSQDGVPIVLFEPAPS